MPDDVRVCLFHGMREREEKKKKGGREEVSIDPIVLTQLWLLNVVKKDRGAQNFRVLEYYAVLLLTTTYSNQILQS